MTVGLIFICIYIFLAYRTAVIASNKGYSKAGFFLFAFLGTLVVPLIVALILPVREEVKQRRQLEAGSHRKCPSCSGMVEAQVRVCMHCGRDIT